MLAKDWIFVHVFGFVLEESSGTAFSLISFLIFLFKLSPLLPSGTGCSTNHLSVLSSEEIPFQSLFPWTVPDINCVGLGALGYKLHSEDLPECLWGAF